MGCAFAGGWESGRGSCSSPSAPDCRTVRQRRLTSSLRRARPERKLPTFSPAYAGAGSAPVPCSPGTGSRSPPLSPTPNRLVSVEVRAVGRQCSPAAARGWGSQDIPAPPRHGAPARYPRSRSAAHVPLAQLHQKGRRDPGIAVALQFHPLHLSRLHAHRRVVAGLPDTSNYHRSKSAVISLMPCSSPAPLSLWTKPTPS